MTITELTPGTKEVEQVQRFEVFTGSGRRRGWSDEEKAQIVAESYSSDLSVCAVARRHGLSPSQLFAWRRLAREQQEPLERAPMFVPAIVAAPKEIQKSKRSSCIKSPASATVIELEINGATVRIAPGADAQTIAAVVHALKASS